MKKSNTFGLEMKDYKNEGKGKKKMSAIEEPLLEQQEENKEQVKMNQHNHIYFKRVVFPSCYLVDPKDLNLILSFKSRKFLGGTTLLSLLKIGFTHHLLHLKPDSSI